MDVVRDRVFARVRMRLEDVVLSRKLSHPLRFFLGAAFVTALATAAPSYAQGAAAPLILVAEKGLEVLTQEALAMRQDVLDAKKADKVRVNIAKARSELNGALTEI